MRASNTLLLALPAAFLSCLVTASPSPILNQDSFSAYTPSQSPRWRRITDTLIRTLWGAEDLTDARIQSTPRPAHSFARYGDDVVLRFNVTTGEEVEALAEAAETLLLDVWEFSENWVDLRLSVNIVSPLLGLLPASLQNSHTPLLKERALAQAVHDTYPSISKHLQGPTHDRQIFSPSLQSSNGPENNLFFADYQPLSVINPWMRLLSTLFRTHVRLITIGQSHQGRDIHGLRVGVHPTNNAHPSPPRKTILITGGLHAREWIATSTTTYTAYSLITGYGKSPTITRLLETFDFVFLPTLNPDGYAYTWDTDRLWRKNRQETGNRFCQGIDLDRSFSFQWDGLSSTLGNPCSESFAGQSPFEAVEAKALADWARNETTSNNVEFVGFLDLHSYSQEILFPYSYSCSETPPGLENLQELAFGLEKAIRVTHGHSYAVMPACEGNVALSKDGKKKVFGPRMEAAGGSALDWFYHEMGVRYAYQIKLRDKGTYGFLLPKENIVPTGKEILEAVLYLGDFLAEVYDDEGVSGEGKKTEEVAVPQMELRRRR